MVSLVALLAAVALQAPQPSSQPSSRPLQPPPPADSATRSDVRTVDVQRLPVYEGSLDTLPFYKRFMNRLHVTTRDRVVRREVLVGEGAPYDSARAAETARNLRNLKIFQSASVDSVRDDSSGLGARVVTQDAFTLKPYVSFKSTGGQASYGIGVYESNLFGSLINVGGKFKHDPDRNSADFSARAPRIIDNRVGLYGTYTKLTDGKQSTAGIELPYLSLSARTSLTLTGETFDGRVLRFVGGDTAAADSLHRKFAIVRILAGRAIRAGPRGYLRAELRAQFRRDDFTAQPAPDSFPRSVTAATVLRVEARRAKYIVTRNYRNIGPDEDIDASTNVRIGLAVAPQQWGYDRTGVGPEFNMQTGVGFRRGFVTANLEGDALYNGGGLDSSTVFGSIIASVHPLERHTAVLFFGGGRQHNTYPGAEFDLGLTRGPRAFPQHAFTGDRLFFLSGEYRAVVIPNLKDLVGVGVAAFGDYGGAWYAGSPRRTGTDFGVGVRVGSSKFPSANGAARFDVAYRLKNDVERAGWVIALGSGFVFDRTR